jgi:formylglycine-generating enzyme required for sulfatase activity
VGKRLCGKIGGGPNGYNDYADASLSQWYNACTSHSPTVNIYPYGTTYDAQACNGYGYSGAYYMTVAVGTLASCQSINMDYAGVYDLSGNVYEWEDSCNGTGQSVYCRLRGGSFVAGGYLTCADNSLRYVYRDFADGNTGFRCCSSS